MNSKKGLGFFGGVAIALVLLVGGMGAFILFSGEDYIIEEIPNFDYEGMSEEERFYNGITYTAYELTYNAQKTDSLAEVSVFVFGSPEEAQAFVSDEEVLEELGEYSTETIEGIEVISTTTDHGALSRIFMWVFEDKIIMVEEYPTDDDLFENYFNKYH